MTIQPLQTGLSAVSATDPAAAPAKPGVSSDARKIEESSRQFESMMVRQVLADTFKPTSATGGPAAPGADIYQSFVTDIISDHIAQGGGLGISNMLQSQLQSPKPHASTSFPVK